MTMDEEPSISVEKMAFEAAKILRKNRYMASDLSTPFSKAKDVRYSTGDLGIYLYGGKSKPLHIADLYVRNNGEVHLELYKDNSNLYLRENEWRMIDKLRNSASDVRKQLDVLAGNNNYEISKVKDPQYKIKRFEELKLRKMSKAQSSHSQ